MYKFIKLQLNMLNKLFILLIVVISTLFAQWPMWSNPSLPVGNSDQGVGLSAGDIMISSEILYQFIDWRHDQIDQ